MSLLLDQPSPSNTSTGSCSRGQGSSNAFEMDDTSFERTTSRESLLRQQNGTAGRAATVNGVARHTLGLILLLCVVFLWTLCNFLGSSIFADNTYAKPFFLTYLNTSTFMLVMIPSLLRSGWQLRQDGRLQETMLAIRTAFRRGGIRSLLSHEDDTRHDRGVQGVAEGEAFLKPADSDDQDPDRDQEDCDTAADDDLRSTRARRTKTRTHLGLVPTARLSLTFCILWFAANYFAMACLRYTTVASTTILTSTSSIWTLLIGSLSGTEKFTWRKLFGVLASLVGIALISRVDLTSDGPDSPDSGPSALLHRAIKDFPDKSASELAFGDILALLSAMLYGVYTITLKRTSIRAEPLQLNMPLFFGLVGFFNFVLLFPLFPILHLTGMEKFALPPTRRIWTILLINSVSSLLSDILWAYAMVLTSPLVVTVGLSLTIPLSLVGEMLVQGRYEGWIYWIGAAIVVASFVFVNREEREDEEVVRAGNQGLHRGPLEQQQQQQQQQDLAPAMEDDVLDQHEYTTGTHSE